MISLVNYGQIRPKSWQGREMIFLIGRRAKVKKSGSTILLTFEGNLDLFGILGRYIMCRVADPDPQPWIRILAWRGWGR